MDKETEDYYDEIEEAIDEWLEDSLNDWRKQEGIIDLDEWERDEEFL